MKILHLNVSGMTCAHCESRVRKAARSVPGVTEAKASFSRHRLEITYDPAQTTEDALVAAATAAIEKEGYQVRGAVKERQPILKVVPIVVILLALYLILRYTVGFDFFGYIPKIDSTISLSALFVTGLFTSVHCIAMCGGINLSPERRLGGRQEGQPARSDLV